jgi:hypothetical protein
MWRSVKAVVGVLIGIFGSVMRISNVRGLLTDRHSMVFPELDK